MRGTVVMATYNSAGSIEAVLAEIEEAATILARSGFQLDILLVDNDSPDGTVAIAREQAERLDLDLDAIDVAACAPQRRVAGRLAPRARRAARRASSSPSTPTATTTPARSPTSFGRSSPGAAG